MGFLRPGLHASQEPCEVEALLEASADAVLLLDEQGRIVSSSCSHLPLLAGVLKTGEPFACLFQGASADRVHAALGRASQQPCTVYAPLVFADSLHVEWRFQRVHLREQALVLATGRDISHHKTIQDRLLRQATHDPLTGLANRTLFEDRLRYAFASAQRSGQGFALAALDFDGFKRVNDALGHGAGDELLRQGSRRLLAALRQQDTLSRVGGDEFLALLPAVETEAAALVACTRLLRAMDEPFDVLGHSLNVGTSIGVALYPTHETLDHRLLNAADQALYRAKEAGKGCVRLFSPQQREQESTKPVLERELFKAVQSGAGLALLYQPIVGARRQAVGVEALMRWEHAELGAVSPAQFIPLAEGCGLIQLLGAWALKQACKDIRSLREQTGQDLYVAVNVSARQLRSPSFLSVVCDALEQSGLPGSRLQLEITESCLITDPDATAGLLDEMMRLGVAVAVDDFGTGYSSLAHLRRFSLDSLKIDRSFVEHVAHPGRERDLCLGIVALAQEMGLVTVAEGIETEAQWQALRDAGCDRFQGWLFGKAQTTQSLAHWMAEPRGPT